MLNVDSVKYFKRAYLSSSSAFSPFYAFPNGNHLDKMKQCFKIEDQEKLIEFLKTANSIQLSACQTFKPKNIDNVPWGPTIENPATVGAFKIKSTDELYNSDDSPAIDTLFSFNSQVFEIVNFLNCDQYANNVHECLRSPYNTDRA